MQDTDKCKVLDCNNNATRITSDETSIIKICDECWHKKYKS